MLATRIIPTLLARGSTLVKGVAFNSWRPVGHALQAIRIHNARHVDELIYLDIAATPEGRGPDFKMVETLTRECFMPVTVGGGVRSVEDVRQLLACGADKVAICTAVCEARDLLRDCADTFGSQAIVIAEDVGFGNSVMIRCGRTGFAHDPVRYAQWMEEYGAGEILLTSIDRDGTLTGYGLDLVRQVSAAVDIPVIANGGCGVPQHMLEAIQVGASAVAAGAMFLWTDETPQSAAAYLAERGVTVRMRQTA